MRKTFFIQVLFCISLLATAQVKAGDVIHGKVTDDKGEPLMRVNVIEIDKEKRIISHIESGGRNDRFDLFYKVELLFFFFTASVKVGRGVKSEGELVVSGTKAYVYVPAPWWKTDYFEVRFENPADNKRYFYQLDGEGLRYELVAFSRAIQKKNHLFAIDRNVTAAITGIMHDYMTGKDVYNI